MKGDQSRRSDLERKLCAVYEYERMCYFSTFSGEWTSYRVPVRWSCEAARGPEGRGRASVWARLAGLCTNLRIDPVNYVQWCLSMWTLGLRDPPDPPSLLTSRSTTAYRADQCRIKNNIHMCLRFDDSRFSGMVGALVKHGDRSVGDAMAISILDEGLEVSGLYRYLIAHAIGGPRFLKFAVRFEPEAAVQYQHHQIYYNEFLGKSIPAEFVVRSEQIYDRILGLVDDHSS